MLPTPSSMSTCTQLRDNPHLGHTPDELGPAGAAAVYADAEPQEVIIIYIQAHKCIYPHFLYTFYAICMFVCV